MEFIKILDFFKSLIDITDRFELERDKRIQIISECIVELSGISFLKLGQAMRNKEFEEAYEEILIVKKQLTNCFVKSMPVVYHYGNCEIDELMNSLRLLNTKISFFEKYIPFKDDVEVNTSLCRCINECLDILIYLKEQLDGCNDEVYMDLIAYA